MGLLILAILTFVGIFVAGVGLVTGNRGMLFLKDIEPLDRKDCPVVSIIAAARNEEKNIEEALRSLLNQDYKNFEVIMVNDRSTDGTKDILSRVCQSYSHLKTIHIEELPTGWLGKNYALHQGAQRATGEYLLFTDADVVMDKSALSKAMKYMLDKELSHLAIAPEIEVEGVFLNMMVGTFFYLFFLGTRPWKAKDTKSKAFMGIGAFNLLEVQAYRTIGGHKAIAMRPDDDMRLGKLVKKNGYKQNVLFGEGMLRVEWYSSVREMIIGLSKNFFAGANYNVIIVLGWSVCLFMVFVFPLIAVFVTSGVVQVINLLIVLFSWFLYRDNAEFYGIKRWQAVGLPVTIPVFIYMICRSTIVTIVRRGIYWRGTFYPLDDLKDNRV